MVERAPYFADLIYMQKEKTVNTKHIGALAELQCITYLFNLGYDISVPFGDNCSYDFILDVNHKLYKIQAKTSRLIEPGVYKFSCCKKRINNHKNIRKFYDENEVDYYATFINDKCYLVPFGESSDNKTMRFVPPKNNNVKNITFANEYLAENQINKL